MRPQPTLIDIPGILLRTVTRTIARLLFVVAGALIMLAALFAFGSLFLSTWRTPRVHRLQAVSDVVLAVTTLARELRRRD